MQIGDKVKIISYRSSKLEGLSGVITREYKGIFGVMVEGHKNHNSQYGCYWLRKVRSFYLKLKKVRMKKCLEIIKPYRYLS